MAISRRLILVEVATRLADVTNATGYVGQVGSKYGLPGVEDTPAEPPVKSVEDPRVTPYFILEPSPGRPVTGEGSLGGADDGFRDLDLLLTVRAAAGDVHDLLALVDRIDTTLRGWTPTLGIPGVVAGPLVPQPGYDPPLLTDSDVAPPRHYSPLQYRLTAHV